LAKGRSTASSFAALTAFGLASAGLCVPVGLGFAALVLGQGVPLVAGSTRRLVPGELSPLIFPMLVVGLGLEPAAVPADEVDPVGLGDGLSDGEGDGDVVGLGLTLDDGVVLGDDDGAGEDDETEGFLAGAAVVLHLVTLLVLPDLPVPSGAWPPFVVLAVPDPVVLLPLAGPGPLLC
jgi:hypothetical protein